MLPMFVSLTLVYPEFRCLVRAPAAAHCSEPGQTPDYDTVIRQSGNDFLRAVGEEVVEPKRLTTPHYSMLLNETSQNVIRASY